MGCGTLSRRLRSPYPGFAELSLTEDRLTRDILSIEGDQLVATRHYNWSAA
jgi:hypothetical protein